MNNVVPFRKSGFFGNLRPQFVDSFQSFLSGLGLWNRDKGVTASPTLRVLSVRELHDLYRGDWLSRKICDVPAFDACRAWRSWQAEQDQIEALEATEKAFGLQRKIMGAITKARLYGGSAVLIGVVESGGGTNKNTDAKWSRDAEEQCRVMLKDAGQGAQAIDKAMSVKSFLGELDLDKVGKDDLKFVHVIERWMITAGPRVRDITSAWFGEPNYYMRSNVPIIPAPGGVEPVEGALRPEEAGTTLFIHPSRVIRLIGHDYPDVEMAPDAWGDSVLQTVYEAVKDAGLVSQAIANLTTRANTNVIQVPGLTENLSTEDGSERVTKRFAATNAAQSVVNAILIDKDEDWKQLNPSFGGLHQILQMYLMIASGAADIPATRLLGREPAGQNATGESDLRNYYDRLSAEQEVKYTPLLNTLDEVIIRSTFGERDPDIYYTWNPLWLLTPEQKAKMWLEKSQSFQIDVNAALLPAEALTEGRLNQLIEDGVYPGLEQAMDKVEEEIEEENVPEEELGEDEKEDNTEPQQLKPGDAIADIARRIGWDSFADDLAGGGQSALGFSVAGTGTGGKRKGKRKARKRPFRLLARKAKRDNMDAWGEEAWKASAEARRGGGKQEEKKSKWLRHAYKRLAKAEAWARKHGHGSHMGLKALAGPLGYAGGSAGEMAGGYGGYGDANTVAAGVLFVTPGGQALFMRRADSGLWSIPAGVVEPDEELSHAAAREAAEETGNPGDHTLLPFDHKVGNGVDFTTFWQSVPTAFDPIMNAEHTAFAWLPIDQPPEPLHPGLEATLNSVENDEDT